MVSSALIGLVAFALLFGGSAWAIRRIQRKLDTGSRRRSGSGKITVLARYPLAWQCLLIVVDIEGTRYALTLSRRGGVTLLGSPDFPMPEQTPYGEGFAARLRDALKRGDKLREP